MTALLVDLDACLGDTRPLWDAWLGEAARVLEIEPASLPADRGRAAESLDASAVGNWRTLLQRFAEDRAPVYLRPDAAASAALRRLAASGVHLGAFTDAPEELARVALAQLGASRRVEVLETGTGALARLRAHFGEQSTVLESRADLVGAAG